jgi:hypothetical protein
MRFCICRGCPHCNTTTGTHSALFDLDTTRSQRCPGCQHHRTRQLQQRPSSSSRGYDGEYQRNKPLVIAQARNGRACVICKQGIGPRQKVTVEHLKPLRDGGTSALSNLGPAHSACNTAWNRGRRG